MGLHRFGFAAGNRVGIDHGYIRLVQLDLGNTEHRDYIGAINNPFDGAPFQRIPISAFFAMQWKVKKFRFLGSVHFAWHSAGNPGVDVTYPLDFEVPLTRGPKTQAEYDLGLTAPIDVESDILGPNIGVFGNPGMTAAQLAVRPLMNRGFFGAQNIGTIDNGTTVTVRMMNVAPTGIAFADFPPEDNQLYFEDREEDENEVYCQTDIGCTVNSTVNLTPPRFSNGVAHSDWPWVHTVPITIPPSTPFNPDPATEAPPGVTAPPAGDHAGAITMKIHGFPDLVMQMKRTLFEIGPGIIGGFTTTLEVTGTLEATEFFPYMNSAGQPVFDATNGERLRDPFG